MIILSALKFKMPLVYIAGFVRLAFYPNITYDHFVDSICIIL